MPIYQTTFNINAPAHRVWTILTDLERYPDWNPQVTSARGKIQQGAKIDLRLVLPGRPALNLTATVEDVVPDSLFTWRGHVLAPWFFEGYRRFAIQEVGEGKVSLTHVEDVHGMLAPVFSLLMHKPVERSHHALNDALRIESEKGVPASDGA